MVLTLDLLSCMDRLISVYSTIQSEALQSSTEPIVPSDEDRHTFDDYLKELAKEPGTVEYHSYNELVTRMSQIDAERYQFALIHFLYWRSHLSGTELMTRTAEILYDCFYVADWNILLTRPWFIPEWHSWYGRRGKPHFPFRPVPARPIYPGRGRGFGHR